MERRRDDATGLVDVSRVVGVCAGGQRHRPAARSGEDELRTHCVGRRVHRGPSQARRDRRGKGTAPSLVEDSFWFLYGDSTVGDLWERIRTLMPSDRPGSLSSQSYRDVVAFILQSNKLPPGEKELDADPEALREILITMKLK